jgi:UDP-GlcNAc:undecaprenyl-phosphate/decaprenyl-phosphate GlcNAc-1-phosphate transferase
MASPSPELAKLAIPAAAALAGGALGTVLVRALALRLGIVNAPNPIVPQHTKPVAYLGGVGVGIGAACGALALWLAPRLTGDAAPWPLPFPAYALALPAALFLALGVWDDIVAFRPATKFVLQAVIAALAVALGLWCPVTGIGPADRFIAWFWLVALVNAFNFTDVCDGLLGSLGAVMFIFIAIAYPPTASVAAVAAAACLGFLLFNKPPATIFLGDAGSHLLGFLAAALTLAGATLSSAEPITRWLQPALLLAVPLFEITFLTIIRVRKGLPWWRGSPDHFSLRLQAGGFTRAQTDLIACTFAAAFAGAALSLPHLTTPARLAVVAASVFAALLAAKALLRWEVKPKPKPPTVVNLPSEAVPEQHPA